MKMAFYVEHFMVMRDYSTPLYASPLDACFLIPPRLETNYQISKSIRIYQLCHLDEVETKEHFIFHCSIYYEI